jgi:O-succinylbenzoic acid--CoA ligase
MGLTREELLSVVRATECAMERGAAVFLCDPDWSGTEREQANALMAAGGRRTMEEGWLGIRTGGSSGGVKFARHDERTLSAAVEGFCKHFGLSRVNAVDVLPAFHVSGLMARVRCAATGGTHREWEWKRLERGEFPSLGGAVPGGQRAGGPEGRKLEGLSSGVPEGRSSGGPEDQGSRGPEGLRSTLNEEGRGSGASGLPDLRPSGPQGLRASGSADWVISLVPTQLQRLMALPAAVEWLRGFAIIFLGGGPAWPELTDAAARAGLRVSLSYGMTETAAMVTALQPEEFLAGSRSCGAPLPHARVTVAGDGRISIEGASVFRGYVGGPAHTGEFTTSDFGSVGSRGHVTVIGRSDAMIITGGKKVHPAEVEAGLRASGEFADVDVVVIGVPDPEWGEAVVACYPGAGVEKAPNVERAVSGLAAHQRPKRFVAVQDWPRNLQGKIDRVALRRVVEGAKPF